MYLLSLCKPDFANLRHISLSTLFIERWVIIMKKTAICYFSGTGNSFDIASKLTNTIVGDLFFLPHTQGDELVDHERIIFVVPIYSFGLPMPVKMFVQSLEGFDSKEIHVILHYGGFAGNAAHYTKVFFETHGLSVCGIYKMKMPESYTIVSTVPQFYIRKLLKASGKKIDAIAQSIVRGTETTVKKNIFSFCDKLHEKNAAKWADLPKGFLITEDCTSCEYCESICPAKNITLSSGKPTFHGKCVACLACYHRCPTVAINYGTKTIGKARYQNPNIDFSKMKRNEA